jgi:transcription elongation factor GreA
MSEEKYITPEGKEALERELKELLEVRRPDLAKKLKEAKEMGDLSENADYIDAKEQQGFLEGRINEIQSILRTAKLIDAKTTRGVVNVGSQVTVQENGESPETYKIVGAAEADPTKGKISNESPLGAALLNRKKGDKVKVQTPSGEAIFKVVDIK